MKKRKKALPVVSLLIIAIGLYLFFYSSIESKPNHTGFWFILVLGVSLGVILTRIAQWLSEKDNE